MKHTPTFIAAGIVAAAIAFPAMALDISGAGATFPYPIYAKWADAYKKDSGLNLNYQSIGSGGGIKQITAAHRDLRRLRHAAAIRRTRQDRRRFSSRPCSAASCRSSISKASRAATSRSTVRRLRRSSWAKSRPGTIPAIAKLNPNVKLPKQAIAVVRRSDGSGTTFIFTNYLSKVSADWKGKVGSSTAVEWPVGIGAKGNEGVANNVMNTKGSIGYVETAYAKQNKLTTTKMINKDGKAVAPTAETIMAAAANADWANAPGFYMILTDSSPAPKSWPIAGATFILLPKQPKDPAAAAAALKFFAWAYKNGDKMAEELDYIPMPDNVVVADRSRWKKSQGSGRQADLLICKKLQGRRGMRLPCLRPEVQ